MVRHRNSRDRDYLLIRHMRTSMKTLLKRIVRLPRRYVGYSFFLAGGGLAAVIEYRFNIPEYSAMAIVVLLALVLMGVDLRTDMFPDW